MLTSTEMIAITTRISMNEKPARRRRRAPLREIRETADVMGIDSEAVGSGEGREAKALLVSKRSRAQGGSGGTITILVPNPRARRHARSRRDDVAATDDAS